MRASQYLLATVKETPSDAETASHQLMIRAGLIRKLATGLYTWLPLGLRVLRKVTDIVRDEMDKAGAMEVSMPVVQPAELWLETGRWQTMGPELLRFTDRHERDFCLGPTHEEVITDLVRNEINSYRQLPANLYQIQTKFRDERRPRFGVMRAREFTMKDAYSFHMDQASLDQTYQQMHTTYSAIFSRLGLDFRPVAADSGNIGGNTSHEFHVLADSGEDEIVFSSDGSYAANMEMATGGLPPLPQESTLRARQEVATSDAHSIEDLCAFLSVEATSCIKTLVVLGCDAEGEKTGELVALFLRGDQTLNETKAAKLTHVASPLEFADDELIQKALGCKPGALGPSTKFAYSYADHSVTDLTNFVCGANKDDTHLVDANWDDTTRFHEAVDIRCVQEGDISPDGKGTLAVKRGIEVGHIFQLGDKYSAALKATALDENGKSVVMSMGCYGIGITRIVAAAIEQNHDDNGIIWPAAMAPFDVAIVPLGMDKSDAVREATEQLYAACADAGLTAFLDDRSERPGVKFAEMELLGMPLRVTVGERSLAEGHLELTQRRSGETEMVGPTDVIGRIKQLLFDG